MLKNGQVKPCVSWLDPCREGRSRGIRGYDAFASGGKAEGEYLFPGANTHGSTLEEARENLRDAVALIIQTHRVLVEESLRGLIVMRETMEGQD